MSDPTPRRGFVTRLLAGTAAVAGGTLLGRRLGAQAPRSPAPSPPGPAPRPVSAEWDMGWVDRLTGTHRQVFDSPEIAQGTALTQVRTWMNGYAEVYGAKPADMSGVLVIRHAAIPMILTDALWDELELGSALAERGADGQPRSETVLRDPVTGEPARRNPFLSASMKGNARYSMLGYPDAGFDALMADGVTVLACNLALRRPIGMVMRREKVDSATARAKVLANVLPGVILMPSGIFATARAQEAGCTFMQA